MIIHVQNGRCTVQEAHGQVKLCSPQAAGLALLGIQSATPASTRLDWTDLLASTGVAVGYGAGKKVVMQIIPATRRSIKILGDRPADLTVTFPPMLVALKTRLPDGRFQSGRLMMIDPTRIGTASIAAPITCLRAFPYGNIWHDDPGKICWGTVAHTDIRTIQDLIDRFFNSGFNQDLFSPDYAGGTSLDRVATASTGGILPAIPTFNKTIAWLAGAITGSAVQE